MLRRLLFPCICTVVMIPAFASARAQSGFDARSHTHPEAAAHTERDLHLQDAHTAHPSQLLPRRTETPVRITRAVGRIHDARGAAGDVRYLARFDSAVICFRPSAISIVRTVRLGAPHIPAPELSAHRTPTCRVRTDTATILTCRVDVRFRDARADVEPILDADGAVVYRGLVPNADLVCTASNGRFAWSIRSHDGTVLPALQPIVEGGTMHSTADGVTIETPLGSIQWMRAPEDAATGDVRLPCTRLSPSTAIPAVPDVLPRYPGRVVVAAPAPVPSPAARALTDAGLGYFGREEGAGNRITGAGQPFVRWSTYLGGEDDEFVTSTGIAPDGGIIAAGWTTSFTFPASTGAVQTTKADTTDAFVTRFNADGTRAWTTYLGGRGIDIAMALALDRTGRIAVVGMTSSGDLPGRGTSTLAGSMDAFVSLFAPEGTLDRTWYFGGSLEDEGHAVTFTRAGSIVITGRTVSTDLPTDFSGFQFTKSAGIDAFIASFTMNGTKEWATYYGGNKEDWGHAVTEDPSGDLLISGHTESTTFPVTPNAFQTVWQGYRDGFFVRMRSNGSRVYATYVGGNDWDDAYDIRCDSSGTVVVGGGSASTDFPVTPEAYQRSRVGGIDAFVATFNSAGQRLWCTLFGGAREDLINGIALFQSGNIIASGLTHSANLPVTAGAFQPAQNGVMDDAFLVKFSRSGHPVFSTYYGGSGNENTMDFRGLATVATDRFGTVSFGGWTGSTDFPVTPGAFQENASGHVDGFLTVLGCTIDPPVIAVAEGPTSLCDGDSVRITAPMGYAYYEWSSGEHTPSIVVRTSGVHSVFVIDTNDCGGVSNAIAVTVHPLPAPRILALGDTVLCAGDSVLLDAGAGYARQLWNTGDTTRIIRVDATGTYQVTVTDANGCSGTSPGMDVVVHPRPSTVIGVSGPLVFCSGGSVTLDAGAGFTAYRWTTGETSRTITATTSGRFTVTVTNPFGCTFTAAPVQVTVHPLPDATITPLGPVTFCDGDSVVLEAGAGPLRYAWTGGATTRSIVVRTPGTYRVTVTDTNQCSAVSQPVDVVVNPRPTPVITPAGPTVFCEGDSVVLDAGPGYAAYAWSTGESLRTITVRQTADIRLTVSYATGCSATSADLHVEVHPDPRPVITPDGPLVFCDGDSVRLFIPRGFVRAVWNTGDTVSVLTVRTSGTYRVTVEDVYGCRWTSPDIQVTVHPLPAIPLITQVRDTLVSTPEYAWQWFLDGQPLPGATAQRLVFPRSGTYTVTVTNADGCSATSAPIAVTIARTVVRIPDLTAAPGEVITVPLILESSEGLAASGAREYHAVVRASNSIFMPLPPLSTWKEFSTDRTVELSGTWVDSTGTLASFTGMAMLGAVERIPFEIDTFYWTAGAVRVETHDGSLQLIICREGGARLVDASAVQGFVSVRPNPFNASALVTYRVIEDALVRISVFDALGREVAVLRDGPHLPGEYTVTFDAAVLPSGVYHCLLFTGSATYTTRLLLMK